MLDLLERIGGVGRRLAEAGREAREASAVVAGEVTDQMTRALGVAAGEVIRAAVVGAVATVVRGAQRPVDLCRMYSSRILGMTTTSPRQECKVNRQTFRLHPMWSPFPPHRLNRGGQARCGRSGPR